MTDKSRVIAACHECLVACERCTIEMLGREGKADCPQCCRECAAICELCVRASAGNWHQFEAIMQLCAETCRWCAASCGANDHDVCQECAKACQRCSEACEAAVGV